MNIIKNTRINKSIYPEPNINAKATIRDIIKYAKCTKQLFESINNGITNILVGIKDWILKIPNLVMSIVFGFIALYFMCTDKIYMIDQLEHHLPDIWTKKISKHLHAIIQKLGHY